MVLVQKWPFFQLVFLGNIGQENVFYYILQQKNTFVGYKKKKFKKSKNWHFSKGVNPWFWSKNGHFSILFFLGNIRWKNGQKNVFYDILQRKNDFLSYTKKNLKNLKNWHFSKGFWFKSGHFCNLKKQGHFCNLFFFRQYRPWKCLLRYSRTKKRLSRL